jgi:hypothetical protein
MKKTASVLLFFLLSFAGHAQKIREGKHAFTLQWISFEMKNAGSVIIKKTGDSTYSITGAQRNKASGDYVTIKGTLTRGAAANELIFKGDLEVKVSHINGGQPCKKETPLTFKATGKRKYWRCQKMLNCDGVVTDYVDIFF